MDLSPEALKLALEQFTAAKQRGIPPITEEQLDGFLAEAEAAAKADLLKNRSLEPFARLIVPATGVKNAELLPVELLPGGLAVMQMALSMPDDPKEKSRMLARLRFACNVLAAMAVVLVSDTWVLLDKDGDPHMSEAAGKFVVEHGTVAAARAGMGRLAETAMITVQTRDRMRARFIPYERRLRGGAVLSPSGQNPLGTEHTISFLKPWIRRCPEDGPPGGNFVMIYREETTKL